MEAIDIITDEIYYHDSGRYQYLIKGIENSARLEGSSYINIRDRIYNNCAYINTVIKELRLATKEEKDWFLECEDAKSYLDNPLILGEITNNRDLIVGNYYTLKHKNWDYYYIIKHKCSGYLCIRGNRHTSYENLVNGNYPSIDRPFKLASREDIDWLEACIKADKLVDNPSQTVGLFPTY